LSDFTETSLLITLILEGRVKKHLKNIKQLLLGVIFRSGRHKTDPVRRERKEEEREREKKKIYIYIYIKEQNPTPFKKS